MYYKCYKYYTCIYMCMHVYETIMQPIWKWGIQIWGTITESHIRKIEKF